MVSAGTPAPSKGMRAESLEGIVSMGDSRAPKGAPPNYVELLEAKSGLLHADLMRWHHNISYFNIIQYIYIYMDSIG